MGLVELSAGVEALLRVYLHVDALVFLDYFLQPILPLVEVAVQVALFPQK